MSMTEACEISNILTNVMNTMYETDETQSAPVLMAPSRCQDMLMCLTSTQMSVETQDQIPWHSLPPQLWSKQQVLEWISYHVERSKYDASDIDFTFCNMEGPALCQLSSEQLVGIFGPLGEQLYQHLRELSMKYGLDESPGMDDINKFLDDVSELLQGDERDYKLLLQGDERDYKLLDTVILDWGNVESKEPNFDLGYESAPTSPDSLSSSQAGSLMSQGPNSPDSGGSDLDFDNSDIKYSCSTKEVFFKTEGSDLEPCSKRRRGRPRKIYRDGKDYLESKRSKHSPRGTHLWEFIRDILIHPELNEGLMKWEDRSEGVFKFLKSEAVAQLWGQKKKNSSMTYEKLSRAMRYYYKREILERVDGRRLVYKFGKNASGWKEDEISSKHQ